MWENILLFSLLSICVITDVKSRKIYNKVLFPTLVIALFLHIWTGGFSSFVTFFIGLIVGLAILLIPYLTGGMGAGDVKLLAVIGAIKGAQFVVWTSLYMALVGGVIALLILMFRKGILTRFKYYLYMLTSFKQGVRLPLIKDDAAMKSTYPYGVAIALGAIFAVGIKSGGSIL